MSEKKLSIWNEVVEKQTLRGVGRSFGLLSVSKQKVSTKTSLHIEEQSWCVSK